MMRTTVDLDENVLRSAKAIARDEGVSLGVVLSRLARRGLAGGEVRIQKSGFPVFDVPVDAQVIDLDVVNEFRDGF